MNQIAILLQPVSRGLSWMDHERELLTSTPQTSSLAHILNNSQTVMWLLTGAICVLLLTALSTHAQSAKLPVPENASSKSYGDGWECNIGYRLNGETCLSVVVPENAFETKRRYGSGWECLHGFRQSDESECTAVIVTVGEYWCPSRQRWHLSRGFI